LGAWRLGWRRAFRALPGALGGGIPEVAPWPGADSVNADCLKADYLRADSVKPCYAKAFA
jgi:hypothetical protein